MRRTKTHLYFWGGIYSQWAYSKFIENDIEFTSAEQYMMYKKALLFDDIETSIKILNIDNPRKVKKLGREIKNFDNKIWNENKIDIVTQGNILKFSQNEKLMNIMFEDCNLTLVEASPYDKIWGVGLHFDDNLILNQDNWRGENLLGVCIMRAREFISKELNDF